MVLRFGTPCISLENGIFALTVFQTKDFGWTADNMTWLGPNSTEVGSIDQAECYYKGLNEGFSPYERKQSWWNVFAARLGFVLAFQVRLKHSNLGVFVVGFFKSLIFTLKPLIEMR